ncbi:MAG TPA: cation diffusion facilitator family transporter [Deltaproteobacteria bacterium]|jgi:cobalt-zinc-cadmium efflux system protein|nr:cation diffusion facilitator family transporter [Deltaproteobacteria bacterium]HOI08045.1 cation diffusion facilitator family transporter [Deltaproteobacteria bacterium]
MNREESGAHDHHHHHHEGAAGIRQAFFLNLLFTVIEIAGGILTNSMAILADAIHDLGDSFALGSAWYFERLSGKAGDEHYSYGYQRFSLLGALINIIILIVGSFFILSQAIPRLFYPEPSHAPGMIGFAVLGILVNGVAALRLRGKEGMNVTMVTWHLLEDVLGWAAILVTGLVLLFWQVHWLDAFLSILITGYVLFNVLRNLKPTMTIFLQGIPGSVNLPAIEEEVGRLDGVGSIHHAHVWTLDGHDHILTMHVVIPCDFDRERILHLKERIRDIMASHGIDHSTVEFEFEGEECRIMGRNCRNGGQNGSCRR